MEADVSEIEELREELAEARRDAAQARAANLENSLALAEARGALELAKQESLKWAASAGAYAAQISGLEEDVREAMVSVAARGGGWIRNYFPECVRPSIGGDTVTRAELEDLLARGARGADELANSLKATFGPPNDNRPLRAALARAGEQETGACAEMTKAQIEHMVSRFLGWRLPANFSPDAGISFRATFNENTPWPGRHEPIGTNLFDATQAEAMVRHMIEGMPAAEQAAEGEAGERRVCDNCKRAAKAKDGRTDRGYGLSFGATPVAGPRTPTPPPGEQGKGGGEAAARDSRIRALYAERATLTQARRLGSLSAPLLARLAAIEKRIDEEEEAEDAAIQARSLAPAKPAEHPEGGEEKP